MRKRSWAISLAIHAVVLALLFSFTLSTKPQHSEPVRWQVALREAAAVKSSRQPVAAPLPRPVSTRSSVPAPRPKLATPVRAAMPPLAPPAAPSVVPPAVPVAAQVEAQVDVPIAPLETVAAPAPAQLVTATPTTAVAAAPVRSVAMQEPVPAPSGAASPAKSTLPELDANALHRWHAALAAQLAALKRYPPAAQRMGEEGVVLLEALILSEGQADVAVKKSSGSFALDRAAVKLLQEAIHALSNIPLPAQARRLSVPISYRLEQ